MHLCMHVCVCAYTCVSVCICVCVCASCVSVCMHNMELNLYYIFSACVLHKHIKMYLNIFKYKVADLDVYIRREHTKSLICRLSAPRRLVLSATNQLNHVRYKKHTNNKGYKLIPQIPDPHVRKIGVSKVANTCFTRKLKATKRWNCC